jgi:hypothetical protein
MKTDLNIFDIQKDWLNEAIYLSGLKEEICELTDYLGGSTKAARLSKVSYSTIKETRTGRIPIHLKKFNTLLALVPQNLRHKILKKIWGKTIRFTVQRTNRNRQNLKFPKMLTPDLAYAIGLILGDGHLAGDTVNKTGIGQSQSTSIISSICKNIKE